MVKFESIKLDWSAIKIENIIHAVAGKVAELAVNWGLTFKKMINLAISTIVKPRVNSMMKDSI